jgi:hypothetical protein
VGSSITRILGPRIGALLFAIVTLTASGGSNAAVYVSVQIAPPLLPVYEQPLIPGAGYIWTPGYWAWGPDGFYWVPGTWVVAPYVGALWTPGYWAWGEGLYFWHAGYWGPHVGFYGGIDYGYGYTGSGYQGGYWEGRSFRYNRAVNNVHVTNITHTYNTTIINPGTATHVSYNGGSGGVMARPTSRDRIAEREAHTPLLPIQANHELAASSNHALLASVNRGHPMLAATPRPERFSTGGPAPARRFSTQAAVQPGAVPQTRARARQEGPTAGEKHPQGPPQVRMQRGVAPEAKARPQGPPQVRMQREGPPQAQARPQGPPQAQMRSPGSWHPQAQVQPQGIPLQQGQPPREAREPHGGPGEHQHPS